MDLGGLRKVGGKTEGAGVGTNARMQRMMALDAFGLMLNETSKSCARELQYKQRGTCACFKRLGLLRQLGSRLYAERHADKLLQRFDLCLRVKSRVTSQQQFIHKLGVPS